MNWTKEDAAEYERLVQAFRDACGRVRVRGLQRDKDKWNAAWQAVEDFKNARGGTIPKQEENK